MIGELIGESKGKITGIRILPGEHTEMSVNGSGRIFGIEATYASTGVFSRMPNGELMEKGNGLITTLDHDVAVMRIRRLSVAIRKGRAASFREATYYVTSSEKLGRHNRGLFCRFNDSVSIAEKVTEILENKSLWKSLEQNAHSYSRKFTWPMVAKKYFALFNELAKPSLAKEISA